MIFVAMLQQKFTVQSVTYSSHLADCATLCWASERDLPASCKCCRFSRHDKGACRGRTGSGRGLSAVQREYAPRDREVMRRHCFERTDAQVVMGDLALDSKQFSKVLFRARKRLRALGPQADIQLPPIA